MRWDYPVVIESVGALGSQLRLSAVHRFVGVAALQAALLGILREYASLTLWTLDSSVHLLPSLISSCGGDGAK